MMLDESYPFQFIQRQNAPCDTDLENIELYKFRSSKTRLWYIVRVEFYRHHVHAVKFYLKNHRLSDKKYQILTNTFEPRRIIYSVLNVMFQRMTR